MRFRAMCDDILGNDDFIGIRVALNARGRVDGGTEIIDPAIEVHHDNGAAVQAELHMDFVPAKRQRLKEMDFDLGTLEMTSPTARGVRMAPKPVSRVKLIAPKEGGKPSGSSGGSKAGAAPKKAAKKAAKGSRRKSPGSGSDGSQGDLF